MKKYFQSPVHICLVGAVALSTGTSSVIGMLGAWLREEAHFSFGFLLIFIGLGLLRVSKPQRNLLGTFLALAVVMSVIILIVSLVTKLSTSRGLGGLDLIIVASFTLALIYGFVVVWSTYHDEWFSQGSGGQAPPFVIPVTLMISVLGSLGTEYQTYQYEKNLSEIYHYDFKVRAIDAKTGELIEYPVISRSWESGDNAKLPENFRGFQVGSSDEDKSVMFCEGYALNPFEVTLPKKGYGSATVTVNRTMGDWYEMKLNPIKKTP